MPATANAAARSILRAPLPRLLSHNFHVHALSSTPPTILNRGLEQHDPIGLCADISSSTISSLRGSYWFHCPHKSTHELALHLRGDGIHINALANQKRPCVLYVINSGRLNIDGFKSGLRELFVIFRISKGTRNAPNPQEQPSTGFYC